MRCRQRREGRHRHGIGLVAARLREWVDAGVKRKAIENQPNGDPNDSAPERWKTANPLFVL